MASVDGILLGVNAASLSKSVSVSPVGDNLIVFHNDRTMSKLAMASLKRLSKSLFPEENLLPVIHLLFFAWGFNLGG